MRKVRWVFLLTFGGIGLMMLIAGLWMGFHYDTTVKDMTAVTGTVVDYQGDRPVVEFTMDGRTWQVLGTDNDDMPAPLGGEYPLMVDPAAPDVRYMDRTLNILRWIFTGIGAVFALVGAGLFIGLGTGEKRRAALADYGRRVQGEVVAVKRNLALKVNNRSPWRLQVKCVHPLTGEEVILRSHNLWNCPWQEGDKVDVLFDPMDERKFAVNVQEEKA